MLDLKNIVEQDVEKEMDKLLAEMGSTVCTCENCRNDIAAFALNRLRPSYVRTEKGEFYHKINASSEQAKNEVYTAVMSAISVVSQNPNHA